MAYFDLNRQEHRADFQRWAEGLGFRNGLADAVDLSYTPDAAEIDHVSELAFTACLAERLQEHRPLIPPGQQTLGRWLFRPAFRRGYYAASPSAAHVR